MIEQQDIQQLPEGWKWVKLGEVCEIISGKNQSKVQNENGKYPIYGSSGIFGYADDYLCNEGTTVVGRKGTINSPLFVKTKFWNVDTAFGLSPNKSYDNKLLYYFCRSFNFHKLDKSTTIPSLAKRDLLAIDLPLPPKPTQQAIVSKIEELFSELDKGIEQLKTAQQQLKTYRQSVLKWAFKGSNIKPIPFSAIVTSYQNGISKRNSSIGSPYKVLRLGDIKEGEIDSKEPREIKLLDSEIDKYKLHENDLIVIRVNGSKELVGRFILVKTKDNWAFCDHFIRIRLDKMKVLPKIMKYYAESRAVRRFIELNMVSSAGQNTISQTTLSSLVVLLPSIEEQNKIVQEIESRLSVADKMEESITQSLQKAEALRQSILKKAFDGKLV